jgi:hypothetical protein
MNDAQVDELAKRLDGGRGSRRRALLLLAGIVAPALAPNAAEAGKKAQRRCLNNNGAPLARGACRCALTCATVVPSVCNGNDACSCGESLKGKGICIIRGSVGPSCSAASPCPTGAVCIQIPGCPEGGGPCTTKADCPAQDDCVNGRCVRTVCLTRCPPAS